MVTISTSQCPFCRHTGAELEYTRVLGNKEWGLHRCQNCHLRFTSPSPTADELRALHEGDYHSQLRVPGTAESEFGEKFRRYIRTIKRNQFGRQLLDVGASTGLFVKMLCDSGYSAEGVELNEQNARWGGKHYNIRIHSCELPNLPYASGSLDGLILGDVLEHTPHPRDFLRSAGRLLKTGGLALVCFPDILSLESRYYKALSIRFKCSNMWRTCNIPYHTWEFTPDTAVACFKSAGFHVQEFRRSQLPFMPDKHWKKNLLFSPSRILQFPILRRLLGTQMEFVVKKDN